MLQGAQGGGTGLGVADGVEAVQDPKGVNRADVQADRVGRLVVDEGQELGDDVGLATLHEQPLSMCSPEKVVVLESFHKCFDVTRVERNWLRLVIFPTDDPVDSPVSLVAERGDVGVPFAGLEAFGCRVVLDDVAVPVNHPDLAVGAHLGGDRRGPFIVAGDEVPTVFRGVVRSILQEDERRGQVAGRLRDERRLVPVGLGIGSRGVDRVSGGGGEPAEPVHLANLLGDGVKLVRAGDVVQDA